MPLHDFFPRPSALLGQRLHRPARSPLSPRKLPLSRLIPNMLTLLALCSGLTAVRYAIQDKWEHAIIAVLIAAVFDTLDGRVARLLNSASRFGAELDSLSDVISFGVAPALIMFLWSLQNSGGVGWIASLAFAVCCALRLARFNTMLDTPPDDSMAWKKAYFVGVPAPAGAGLGLLPLILALAFPVLTFLPSLLLAMWLLCIGGLMVSRWPTFSLKGIRVPVPYVVPLFVGVVLIAAGIVTNTWLTLGALGIGYMGSLPLSWRHYQRREQQMIAEAESARMPGGPHDDLAHDETNDDHHHGSGPALH